MKLLIIFFLRMILKTLDVKVIIALIVMMRMAVVLNIHAQLVYIFILILEIYHNFQIYLIFIIILKEILSQYLIVVLVS